MCDFLLLREKKNALCSENTHFNQVDLMPEKTFTLIQFPKWAPVDFSPGLAGPALKLLSPALVGLSVENHPNTGIKGASVKRG